MPTSTDQDMEKELRNKTGKLCYEDYFQVIQCDHSIPVIDGEINAYLKKCLMAR
jgi:hypothetical protein